MPYKDTFIQIAPDSTASEGTIPADNRAKKTIHLIQYELLSEKPYHYTHEDLVFAVHVLRQNISDEVLAAEGEALRANFLQKEHPCLRASALTKKYGWGAHYNSEGKIAIYPVESEAYARISAEAAENLFAMRSSRKQ